jgi:hypothetical protein
MALLGFLSFVLPVLAKYPTESQLEHENGSGLNQGH